MKLAERRAFRARCKAEHLCYRCGKPLDKNIKRHYCEECEEIRDKNLQKAILIMEGISAALFALSEAIPSKNDRSGDNTMNNYGESFDLDPSIGYKWLENGRKCPDCGNILEETDTYWECPECMFFEYKPHVNLEFESDEDHTLYLTEEQAKRLYKYRE